MAMDKRPTAVVRRAGVTIGTMTEAPTPADAEPEVDPLAAGRAAVKRKSWPRAVELLTAADTQGSLAARDLEALSLAAFFAGRPEVEDDARERAFRA